MLTVAAAGDVSNDVTEQLRQTMPSRQLSDVKIGACLYDVIARNGGKQTRRQYNSQTMTDDHFRHISGLEDLFITRTWC